MIDFINMITFYTNFKCSFWRIWHSIFNPERLVRVEDVPKLYRLGNIAKAGNPKRDLIYVGKQYFMWKDRDYKIFKNKRS